MKKYIFIIVFLVTLVMSGLYCAPYYAVNKLQKSAIEGDFTTLSSYVDYDKVRASCGDTEAYQNIISPEGIAHILQQSMIAPQSADEQDRLDMTMGFSGDDHFMLSFESVAPDSHNEKVHGPIIFVLEKESIFHWHVTEIVLSD
ncbi:MAG: DUF2939 domain-containing protein [Pseudomonadota bacterium]